MKRMLTMLLCLLLLCPAARGEDILTFEGVTVDRSAAVLDLGDRAVTNIPALEAVLRQMPNLRQVNMYETVVEPRQMDAWALSFPDVRFGVTIHIVAEHYIRTDATAFSTLHGYCPAHKSQQFEVLKYCPDLQALDLGHNELWDLEFLTYFPHLKVLILADCGMNGIGPLAELKELEYLELFTNDIRDISPLFELPHLLDLNLCNNGLIYRFSDLLELPQSIQRLWVANLGTYIGSDRLRELRQALPNAVICTEGDPTGHGWRVGEHYETIYEMFQTGVYRPFSDSWTGDGAQK